MTAGDLERMRSFMNAHDETANDTSRDSIFVGGVSEDPSSYDGFPKVDYVIACPPYFKLEEYPCDGNSTGTYPEYPDWLEKYWRMTVRNAVSKMRNGAKFSLIMVERWNRFELLADMRRIMKEEGLSFLEELSYRTTRSHLTDKRKSGNMTKNSEKIVTFVK